MKLVYNKWIEHDGKGCRVPCGYVVDVDLICIVRGNVRLTTMVTSGESWSWENYPKYSKIVSYRIHKPKGIAVLEKILVEMPIEVLS